MAKKEDRLPEVLPGALLNQPRAIGIPGREFGKRGVKARPLKEKNRSNALRKQRPPGIP